MVSAAAFGAKLLPPEEGLGFSLNTPGGVCRVDVELANTISPALWEDVFRSRLLQDWLRMYARPDRLRLLKVAVQHVQQQQQQMGKQVLENLTHDGCPQVPLRFLSLALEVEAADSTGEVIRQPVLLQPLRRAVLLLLRNSETHADSCVFVKQINATLGTAAALSLPEGEFETETGRFSGPHAAALEKLLGSSLHERDCVNMTRIAFGGGGVALRCCSTALSSSDGGRGYLFGDNRGSGGGAGAAGGGAGHAATMMKAMGGGEYDHCEGTGRLLEERVEIYLYRCNMDAQAMEALEKKIGRLRNMKGRGQQRDGGSAGGGLGNAAGGSATQQQQQPYAPNGLVADHKAASQGENDDDCALNGVRFSLVQLGKAWSLAADAVAVTALFLVHELRYHCLMPAFRQSTKSLQAAAAAAARDLPKAAATYCRVSELDPDSKGVNLRVRVQEPIVLEKERVLPNGKIKKDGHLVVGDDQAIITFKVTDQQFGIPDEVGQPLLIRNAQIAMDDGHMKLVVDRWGKVTADIPEEELAQFPTHVNKAVDMSATEYELVQVKEEECDGGEETGAAMAAGNAVTMAGGAGAAGGAPAAGIGRERRGGAAAGARRGRGGGVRGRRRGRGGGVGAPAPGSALYPQQK